RFGALALVLVLLLAACGGSDDDGGSEGAATDTTEGAGEVLPSETGWIGEQPDDGPPVDGGVLRAIVTGNDTGGLDPVKNLGSGQTLLTEITAIFDQLMRYDPIANEYVPHLAESLTPNDDHSQYTLKLRPGVTFTDGTPLDAAAVKF